MTQFRTNYNPVVEERPKIKGKDCTLPNQVSSLTEIIYRFQGGIIPNINNVSFDPIDSSEDYINVANVSGFDITDAYRALQEGKKTYQSYIKDKNEKARTAIQAKELELQQLREFKLQQEQQQKLD